MAEGDTILKLARRLEGALGGKAVSVDAPNPRGRATGIERLDGLRLEATSARGKHLLLDFGPLTLHSHLAMSGGWHLYRPGERWRRSPQAAWAVLAAEGVEAVQFGGPTLRLLRSEQVRRDPTLSRLGPDILAPPPFSPEPMIDSVTERAGGRSLGEILLDQSAVSGIGNIFKSEACFAAGIDPWLPVSDLTRPRLAALLESARQMMLAAVDGAPRPRQVYRRAGEPCRRCGTAIGSRGQGEANRTTYWCPGCQS